MKQFLIDIQLPINISENFIKQIPDQHEQIEQMMESGVIRSYSLSADRSRLSMVFNADHSDKVQEILQEFKLYEYFDTTVTELFFYKEAPEQLPAISLN
ncbi:MAG: muconolactone Delta-isomerase family protein [Chitinophagales bacterium]